MDPGFQPQTTHKAPVAIGPRLSRLRDWTSQLWHRRPASISETLARPTATEGALPLAQTGNQQFNLAERRFLLGLARRAVESCAGGAGLPEAGQVPTRLAQNALSFVTLTIDDALRGCVGHLLAKPLFQGVMENARAAACHDARFPPIRPVELPLLRIEISVLTEPRRVQFQKPEELLALLRPGEDGVLLQAGPRLATFLPQVWLQIPDKVDFMGHLSLKAGCSASAWRDEESVVSIYQVESFSEARATTASDGLRKVGPAE